ncbi:MAG: serine/threonine protein kinase [Planctomycetota bacterium]|nr:MAG: serine/threonine protein kinase [Planctomycetota bacterium]REK37978.1 MAG: serine/threonine protein kinase [Planctomycetota bacterium]
MQVDGVWTPRQLCISSNRHTTMHLQRKLDDFKLGELLGTGTVGTVYAAEDRTTGQEVAVKILLPEVSLDRNIVARFEREMLILSKLSHPNIIRYYGGGGHDFDRQGATAAGGHGVHRLFYAMELVHGGSLKQVLTSGKLPWQQAVRYGIKVCSALQHAHNYGIVHRDLKPGNLYLTYNGELKLGDFGIALDTGEASLTATGLIVGSYLYMAPEQIRGETGRIGNQTDLYALGCILYEMLVGRPPFQGATFAQIFDQHLKDDPVPLAELDPSLPKSLCDIVMQCLAKNPYQRPLNARHVQGVLSELDVSWDREDEIYRAELSRLRKIFDAGVIYDQGALPEVSWARLGMLAGMVVVICLLFWLFANLS